MFFFRNAAKLCKAEHMTVAELIFPARFILFARAIRANISYNGHKNNDDTLKSERGQVVEHDRSRLSKRKHALDGIKHIFYNN